MKRRLCLCLALVSVLLAGCTAVVPAAEPVDTQRSPDTTIPTWRVGDSGELKRIIVGQQNGEPLECVVFVGVDKGGVSCNWDAER